MDLEDLRHPLNFRLHPVHPRLELGINHLLYLLHLKLDHLFDLVLDDHGIFLALDLAQQLGLLYDLAHSIGGGLVLVIGCWVHLEQCGLHVV